MEFGALTNISILILMLAFILIGIRWMSLKRIQHLLKPLQSLAEKSNAKITHYDAWNHTIIGLDKNKQQVFFIKTTEEKQTQQTIPLSEVQKCRINNSSRPSIDNQTTIEKLELVFTKYGKNGEELSFEFYNARYDNLTINQEFLLIQKWQSIISDELKKLNKN